MGRIADVRSRAAVGERPWQRVRSMSEEIDQAATVGSDRKHTGKAIATFVYALQAASFLVGFTSVVGVIVNYVKLDDVRGTWVESHFRWQIRTFWFSLLWSVIGAITVYILIGWLVLAVLFLWMIYRIVKGWLYLNDGKPMYVPD